MKKYFAIIIAIIMVSCNQHKTEKPVMQEKKNYQIGEVSEKQLSSSVNLPGELKPFEIVQIFPKVNGFIKDIKVDIGSKVKKGDVLIVLDAPEVEQQYLSAKSKWLQSYSLLVASRDHYERLLATSKTPGTVAPYEIEMAKSKMLADSAVSEAEKSNYKALDATRNYLVVTAPFDGVITERNVHPGALVGPNSRANDKAMVVLEKESVLRLTVNVPEIYSSQLSLNSNIEFRVSTMPGKIFKGKISRSSNSLSTKFRSETIEIDVKNESGDLKPGMYAEVTLPIQRKGPALVVPVSAVITSTERKFVITIRKGKAVWKDVETGNLEKDSTEIFGDIHVGDKVILGGSDELKEGTDIQ